MTRDQVIAASVSYSESAAIFDMLRLSHSPLATLSAMSAANAFAVQSPSPSLAALAALAKKVSHA